MSFPRYDQYKDSGVEWLGEVPAHWEVRRLKAIASCNDEVLPEFTVGEMEIQYVEISGVDANQGIIEITAVPFAEAPSRARRCVKDGDVLVSTVRTYLRAIAPVKMPPDNMIASTGFAVIRPQSVQSAFLGYLCRSEFVVGEIISRSVGVSYPAINASDLMRVHVALPNCIAEQDAIAAFLDRQAAKIDALVAEQEKLIALLKEKRQAVISHAVTKGLDPTVPMKDSGNLWLGEIPAHWDACATKHLISVATSGPRGWSEMAGEMGSIFFRSQNIGRQMDIVLDDVALVEPTDDAESQRAKLQNDDVVVCITGARTGSIAHVNYIDIAYINQHVCLLRPDNNKVMGRFLAYVLSSCSGHEQLQVAMYGLKQGLALDDIQNQIVPCPPRDEQASIVTLLDRDTVLIDALTAEAQRAIALLKEHRAALISAAVTGKIDVRGLVAPMPPSAAREPA